ncbi:MAG TPA: c-type cytochrome [Gammaproteobacteria bacterium]|nr:c-type cytochrome [Gammaproteobacteria bacterium]
MLVLVAGAGGYADRALAQAAPAPGAELFALCAQCHGPVGHGNPGLGAPGLTALEPWYLARQLRGFAQGLRGDADADPHEPVMETIAHAVADEATIASLIAHVDGLPEYVPAVTIVGDTERGRQLFEACASCHGAAGEGDAVLGAPGLAYRDDWYLRAQIEAFLSGERGSHRDDMYGQQMVPVSRVVTDAQAVLDLVAFINTLE